ncbi:Peroxisomal membrane protein PEX32 [Nakaseomyces bracarensis]|uniref:Peroxisomal membrane protein PEX32 n=1 Tax=Nakaseomyces bracarensis TaxID=273131 RepID=A0ABR4P115_9SACH
MYHAKFINSHGQKPSLTLVTPSMLSMTLAKVYPLLVIVDAALDNLMWICEDRCLPFLYVVMIYLSTNMFSWSWEDPVLGSQVTNVMLLWVEVLSSAFLFFATSYFISSVYYSMSSSEPPTVDDIIINLESLLDKLETLRNEIMFRRWFKTPVSKYSMLRIFARLALVLTPLHYVMMRVISVQMYTRALVLFALFYHSDWVQVTLRLCWRLLFVRTLYFKIFTYIFGEEYTIFGFNAKFALRTLTTEQMVKLTPNVQIQVPLPIATLKKMNESNLLELFLLRFVAAKSNDIISMDSENKDTKISEFDITGSGDKINSVVNKSDNAVIVIKEIYVFENQRKWKYEGWQPKLLPYERKMYTTNCNNKFLDPSAYSVPSIVEVEKELPTGWSWVEKNWEKSSWVYSDTDWNITGTRDSLEGYTRSRVWKRKIFKL